AASLKRAPGHGVSSSRECFARARIVGAEKGRVKAERPVPAPAGRGACASDVGGADKMMVGSAMTHAEPKQPTERRPVSPLPRGDDTVGRTLRPTRFEEFTGQRRVVENLKTWIGAARRESRPLDHILFTGPPGLGKTTLAHLVASEMGARL